MILSIAGKLFLLKLSAKKTSTIFQTEFIITSLSSIPHPWGYLVVLLWLIMNDVQKFVEAAIDANLHLPTETILSADEPIFTFWSLIPSLVSNFLRHLLVIFPTTKTQVPKL